MAYPIYSYTADTVSFNGTGEVELKVTFQNTSKSYIVNTGLSAIDWNSVTDIVKMTEFPFSLPEIGDGGEYEGGLIQNQSFSFEGHNRAVYVDSSTSYYRAVDVFNFDPVSYACLIRLGIKDPISSTWNYYCGVVDPNSTTIKYGDTANPDTWFIKISVDSNLKTLENITVQQWLDSVSGLQHVLYDLSSENVYLTYVGNYEDEWTWFSGKYKAGTFVYYNSDKHGDILTRSGTPGFVSQNIHDIRFISLTSIFTSFSNLLGLEAPVNDSADWSDYVLTKYYYNTENPTSPGNNATLVECNIDQLYIISGFYIEDQYRQYGTFFDAEKGKKFSFYNYNNSLDVLKFICVSLGLTCSIEINSSGQRYLKIVEAGYYNPDNSVIYRILNPNKYAWGAEFTPFEGLINGVQVNDAFGHELLRGAKDNYVNIDCLFSLPYEVRNNINNVSSNNNKPLTLGYTTVNKTVTPWRLDYIDRGCYEMFSSLFACSSPSISGTRTNDAGSALNIDSIYSVCAIAPGRAGAIAEAQDDMECGLDTSISGYGGLSDGVLYPNPVHSKIAYHSMSNVPQMAIAHYYWSPYSEDDDTISLYRKYQRKLTLEVKDPLFDIHIGQLLNITVGGVYYNLYVISKTINLESMTTKLELVSRKPTYY
jgi:hypothetical protein